MGIDEFCLLTHHYDGFFFVFLWKERGKRMKQILFIKTKNLYLNKLIELVQKQNFYVKEGDYSIGICIDTNRRIMFPLNVTCMCGFSRFDNRPLLDEDVVKNFKELVVNNNENLLDELYKLSKKDLSRPIGGFLR